MLYEQLKVVGSFYTKTSGEIQTARNLQASVWKIPASEKLKSESFGIHLFHLMLMFSPISFPSWPTTTDLTA